MYHIMPHHRLSRCSIVCVLYSILYVSSLICTVLSSPSSIDQSDSQIPIGRSLQPSGLPWVPVSPQDFSSSPSSSSSGPSIPPFAPPNSIATGDGGRGSGRAVNRLAEMEAAAHSAVYVSVEPTDGEEYAPAQESESFPFDIPQSNVQERGRVGGTTQRVGGGAPIGGLGGGNMGGGRIGMERRDGSGSARSSRGGGGGMTVGGMGSGRRSGSADAGSINEAYNRRFGEGRRDVADMREESEEVEVVTFPECKDAKARGYSMPFVCCTLYDGDFFDPTIWHCGRVPTMLDAVFIRHFVRLGNSEKSVNGDGESGNEVRVRALWIVDSVEPMYRRSQGVLRGGMVIGEICLNPDEASRNLPRSQLSGFRRNFRLLLGQRSDVTGRDGGSRTSLRQLCDAFKDKRGLYNEEDFDTMKGDSPVFIRVEGIGGAVPKDIALSVAMTSVNIPQRSNRGGGRYGSRRAGGDEETFVDMPEFSSLRQYTEDGRIRQQRRQQRQSDVEEEGVRRGSMGEEREGGRDTSEGGRREVEGPRRGNRAEERMREDEYEAEDNSNMQTQSRDERAVNGEIEEQREEDERREKPSQGVPDFYSGPLGSYLPSRSEVGRRRLQGGRDNKVRFAEPLKADGPVTLRVDKSAALLLFENVSVDVDGDIRNDGTFFIGETVLKGCLDAHPESPGLCRVPSLVSVGSLVAIERINVLWLQLASSRKATSSSSSGSGKFWYGIAQYPDDLPGNERSTLTFFGDINVKRIIPGFSLSFKRIGFPPNPPPPAAPGSTTVTVKDKKETSDLVIYMDIFDSDGFIDCCEEFYEEHVAEFVVRGTNLKLGRYTDFYKEVGDPNSKISEQIVMRASVITTEQMFVDLPAVIPEDDAVLTNRERPYKLAGINRDIVFFQCTDECHISNQVFKRRDPYQAVEVKRELKKNRSTMQNL
eukprot:GHVQ01041562.1.p1 GENE.GHVQ01041562.1~~GHVQ01041562.1.p1  ORF type:complete len:929 (+),score=227.48 GHVQ01041562.1:716-3502(+)